MERALPFELDKFKKRQLFGIPLTVTDETGKTHEYTDDLIEEDIRAAINEMERRLQIDIWKRKVITRPNVTAPTAVLGVDYDIADDPMDYEAESFYALGYLRLRRWPIISVEKVELRFPGEVSLLVYPKEWLRINHKAGQINIFAISGVSSPVIIGREGGFLPLLSGGLQRAAVPQLFYVDYTSGIDATSESNLPYYQDLMLAIQRLAAANVLEVLGRGRHPGVASESLSEDGQSESSSYARMGGHVYSGEVKTLDARVDRWVKLFKTQAKGVIFTNL